MNNIYVTVKSGTKGPSVMTKIKDIAFGIYDERLILTSRDTGETFASIELDFNPEAEEMSNIMAKVVNKYIKQFRGEGVVMTTGDFINNFIDTGEIRNSVTYIIKKRCKNGNIK